MTARAGVVLSDVTLKALSLELENDAIHAAIRARVPNLDAAEQAHRHRISSRAESDMHSVNLALEHLSGEEPGEHPASLAVHTINNALQILWGLATEDTDARDRVESLLTDALVHITALNDRLDAATCAVERAA